MVPDGNGRVRLDYIVPTRGLIGFRSEFLTLTQGSGLMFHGFDHYGPKSAGEVGQRPKGAIISMDTGKALAYALWNIQERGKLFIGHAAEVYEGMPFPLAPDSSISRSSGPGSFGVSLKRICPVVGRALGRPANEGY